MFTYNIYVYYFMFTYNIFKYNYVEYLCLRTIFLLNFLFMYFFFVFQLQAKRKMSGVSHGKKLRLSRIRWIDPG